MDDPMIEHDGHYYETLSEIAAVIVDDWLDGLRMDARRQISDHDKERLLDSARSALWSAQTHGGRDG